MTRNEQLKVLVRATWNVAPHVSITNATYRQALSYACYLRRIGNPATYGKPHLANWSTAGHRIGWGLRSRHNIRLTA